MSQRWTRTSSSRLVSISLCTNWVKFYQINLLNTFLIILNHSEMHSVPKMDENIKFKARVNQFSKSWLCQKTIQFCARIQFTAMKLNNYCSLTFSLYLQLTTKYLSHSMDIGTISSYLFYIVVHSFLPKIEFTSHYNNKTSFCR